jgi:predicted glycoside hydrolase/deacetylase ChbG (UPF0249 family)
LKVAELRPIVLCADDFALAEGVSEGILQLAEAGRLSAIGCMTASPLWTRLAVELDRVASRCDIGLHLTLTDQRPLSPLPGLAPDGRLPGLGRLMAAAFAGRLDAGEIAQELERQWSAFAAARGRPPAFIDGHQHVHLLPVVRDAVLALVERLPPAGRPYLRVCWEAPVHVLRRRVAVPRALLLTALSDSLRRSTRRLGLAANDSFRGVHAFNPREDYARLFPRFLQGAGRRPLVMCHPGFADAALRALDPVTDHREREHQYFASERFVEDLAAAGCRLARFGDGAAPA